VWFQWQTSIKFYFCLLWYPWCGCSVRDSWLTYIPRGINKISSLRSLNLDGNNITELYPYSFYGARCKSSKFTVKKSGACT
jgi:hypothetical protein